MNVAVKLLDIIYIYFQFTALPIWTQVSHTQGQDKDILNLIYSQEPTEL